MPKTVEALCEQLSIDLNHIDTPQAASLQRWCEETISQDLHYSDDPTQSFERYLALAKHFLEVFLPLIPENIALDVDAFGQMNTVQYAASQGYDRYITALHPSTPEVWNQPTQYSMTPLHLAAVKGWVYTTQALLDKGADPMIPNRNQQLPIYSALLIPILHEPGLRAHKERIFSLLATSAPLSLSHKDHSGDTVFHLMAAHGFNALFKKMLAQNPEIAFYQNNHTHYLIHTAILNQHAIIAELLMSIKGVAELADASGRVALHYAARSGSPEIVSLCVKTTPNINCFDKNHKTPLMLATEMKNINAMEVLIQHGANSSLTDAEGHTILDYAEIDHDYELISWITQHTALKPTSP